MIEEGVLLGISQIGATFAGFIAIFLIFARRDGRFSPADGLRIRALIYASLLIVIGALLPLLLHAYGAAEAQLWRGSAALYFAAGVPASIDAARRHLSMTQQDRREVGLLHSVVSWGLNLVVVAILGSLVLGYGSVGNYVLALVLTIAIVMANFVTLSLKNLL